MAEWLNVPPWKGGIGETLSRVRIPLSPQKKRLFAQSFSIKK